jgi:hypothetical protein
MKVKVGDYIVCKEDIYDDVSMYNRGLCNGFFENNIGRVINLCNNLYCHILYDNGKIYVVSIDNIDFYSSDKEKVQKVSDYLNCKKYYLKLNYNCNRVLKNLVY